MKVISIPVLSDNYAYLIIDEDTGDACVVDPSEAGPYPQQSGEKIFISRPS